MRFTAFGRFKDIKKRLSNKFGQSLDGKEWSQRDMFNTFYHADNHWVPKMVQIKMYQDIVPNLSLSYR